MSYTEQYNSLIKEFKMKRKQEEDNYQIFQNKLAFSNTVNQLNQLFTVGKIKPTQIKPISYWKWFYTFFK